MNALISNPEPPHASSKPAINPPPKPTRMEVAFEWFGRIIVVAAGIVVGTIVASLIALFSGWIEIGC